MSAHELLSLAPQVGAGALAGVAACVPLLLGLVPALGQRRQVDMTAGVAGVFSSFVLLVMGVVLVYVLAPDVLVAFSVGELVGFFVGLAVIVAVAVARLDR